MGKIIKTIGILGALANYQTLAGTMGQELVWGPKNGIFFGAGIGGNFNTDKLETISFPNGSTIVTTNKNYVAGNLYAGYGYTFASSLFLGLEANTYFPKRTINIFSPGISPGDRNIYENQIDIYDYLGLDILPGYNFNPNSLLYCRVGASFRNIDINQNQSLTSASFLNSGNTVGARTGAGLAYSFNKHAAAAIDYIYTSYPNWSSPWNLYSLEFNTKSHTNYVGISILTII